MTYKEITKSYDFLQFLDEIANYTVSENEPAKSQDPSGIFNNLGYSVLINNM